jgi:hypothetical protein
MADLEELADLAAETVAPAEVPAARQRRRGYSAAGLVALLTAGAATPEAAAAAATQTPAPTARRLPPRRRLLGTSLAVLGAGALCAGVLLHLPTPDPAPITGGAGYTTPSPDPGTGGVAFAPVPLDPASPAPLVTSAPLSSPAPRAGAVRPAGQGGPAPAPSAAVNFAPAVIAPGAPPSAPATAPAATAPPTAPPAAPPTAAPTATPSPSSSPSPAGPLTVRSVTLSMGTCEDRGAYWVCPETATFTFAPGAQGTLTFSIAGTATTCSGTSSAFDQAQPSVNIPQGTTRAVVTSALVFPAGSHPAAAAPGRAPSTAAVRVTSPNRISSASQPFGGASCP